MITLCILLLLAYCQTALLLLQEFPQIGTVKSYQGLIQCYQDYLVHHHTGRSYRCIQKAASEHNDNVLNWKKSSVQPSMLSVGLVTFLTKDITDYAAFSIAINLAFAIQNNYLIKIYDPDNDKDVEYDQYDVRWNKIQILQTAMSSSWGKHCDYVMWLDADLIILDMDMDLQGLLTNHSSAHLLASAGNPLIMLYFNFWLLLITEFTGSSTMINSGAIIVKNSKWSKQLLSIWWTHANRTFYSDQEQFDLLYNHYSTLTNTNNKPNPLPHLKERVSILEPFVLNSDPPAMTQQQNHHSVLHLMVSLSLFAAYAIFLCYCKG
jgi:hypothetical protein